MPIYSHNLPTPSTSAVLCHPTSIRALVSVTHTIPHGWLHHIKHNTIRMYRLTSHYFGYLRGIIYVCFSCSLRVRYM